MAPGDASPAQPVDDDFVDLLREHAALCRRLIAALRADPAGGERPEATAAPDAHASGLIVGLMRHGQGVADEAARRGVTEGEALAWFALAAPDVAGVFLEDAFRTAFPGGSADPHLDAWRARARRGSVPAAHVLGTATMLLADSADGAAEGRQQLESAVASGSSNARIQLALIDAEHAERLLREAAAAGSAPACAYLAEFAANGGVQGVAVGDVVEWLERAAAADDVESMLALGRIRATGAFGLPIDLEAARSLLGRAAARHRRVAREWQAKFASLDAATYADALWVEAWTPTESHAPKRTGLLGAALALGFVALLVVGTVRGNSLGMMLLLSSLAVLAHEFGHFVAARLVGVPVAVVTVGIGPVVRSFATRGGRLPMRFDIRLLPLLGSVQPHVAPRAVWTYWNERARCEEAGRPPPPYPRRDPDDEPRPVHAHLSAGRRFAFLVGGLVVNFMAAVAFFWIYAAASPEARLVTAPVVGRVPAGSVAERSGLRAGDRVLRVDGMPVSGFFDVRRRLAPMDDARSATGLADAPGRGVEVVVLRDGTETSLVWVTPAAPPGGDAEDAYGLLPPETWRIARVRRDRAAEFQVDDEVIGFAAGGVETSTASADARTRLEAALAMGPVDLRVRRGATTHIVRIARSERQAAREIDGIEFARLRERGPPPTPAQIIGRVGSVGWRSVVALPATLLAAARKPPSADERTWLVAAVRRDPWRAADIFAWVNAFVLFLNVLPVPPLDGFELAVLGVESAARRPLPRRGLALVRRLGVVLLVCWMALNAFLILRDSIASLW